MHYSLVRVGLGNQTFLRATACTAIARISHGISGCLSFCQFVCLSVCHTSGSVKNGAS